MKLLSDESGQTGIIFFYLVGIFMAGIALIIFGYMMWHIWTVNNSLIASSSLAYSQSRYDAMSNIFLSAWAAPIYILLLFVIFAVKRALDKKEGSTY